MEFIKKNIKLIIGIIVGMLLVSGISVYASYKYFATDVSYTREGTEINSVAEALNDLYSKIPSGSTTIEANGTYDVSNVATAIVQNLYTETEYNANYTKGKNENCVIKQIKLEYTSENNGYNSYNLDFTPSFVFLIVKGGYWWAFNGTTEIHWATTAGDNSGINSDKIAFSNNEIQIQINQGETNDRIYSNIICN